MIGFLEQIFDIDEKKNCSSLEDPGTDVSIHRIPPG
jgi:hypothetical protein